VVYHFGGMDKLYGAVLQEARKRLAPSEALTAAVECETDRKRADCLHRPAWCGLWQSRPSTWAVRLLSREMILAQRHLRRDA